MFFTLPCERNRGITAILVVFDFDAILSIRFELKVCAQGFDVRLVPRIQDQLAVEPNANAVIGFHNEPMHPRRARHNPAGPTHRKCLGANCRIRRPFAPSEIDFRINPGQFEFLEILGVKVFASEPATLLCGCRDKRTKTQQCGEKECCQGGGRKSHYQHSSTNRAGRASNATREMEQVLFISSTVIVKMPACKARQFFRDELSKLYAMWKLQRATNS
jgi:hypothetical protein